MEPRVTKREKKLHLSYELPRRTHTAQLYPVQSPNGSSIIIYGHDRGVRILWRGGRRRKEAQTAPAAQPNGRAHEPEPEAIVIDDDDDDDDGPTAPGQLGDSRFEAEEDELDPDCPYPSIIQDVNVDLGSEVLHVAVPPLPVTTVRTDALRRHAAVAVACSDGTPRVLTFDLLPPANADVAQYAKEIGARAVKFPEFDTACIALTAKIVVADEDGTGNAGQSTSFMFVAAVSDTLRIWRMPVFSDLTREPNNDVQETLVPLPHAASTISFHPSPSSTRLLLSDISGAIRVYDPFERSSIDGEDIITDNQDDDTAAETLGRWIVSFFSPFSSRTAARQASRKRVLDVKWVMSGKAILTLLEDGEWGIWDTTPSGDANRNIADFAVHGFLGAVSDPTHSTRQSKGSSRLAPMTPNTRKTKTETFFSGTPRTQGVASQGGISVSASSSRAGQVDESVILWYNNDIYSITSLQTFWQRSTNANSTSSGGTLHTPSLSHITDINLSNETITSISQFAPNSASSGVGQMNTQRDLLVSGEHRLIISQALRPSTPARQLFQQALAERPASRDQRMLDAGQLDLGGMDRMLDSMSNGDARPRRVGFAR